MKAAASRVLFTGAGGGIGNAAIPLLVKAGASVMLVGRSPARLAAQARALVRDGGVERQRVEWYAADLAREASLEGIADVATGWGCNVLVHGAGVPGFGRIESLAAADMAKVLHLNLLVPMLLTQALLPQLRGLPAAQVIFVGSALGRLGLPGFSVYSASKFGLRGFAESLRRELADTQVRVQYFGPRSTRTGFNSGEVERYNAATGTAMDAPDVAARALLQMLESGKAECFLGFPEKLAVRLNGLAPIWLDGAFHKHRRSLPPVTQAARPVAGRGEPRELVVPPDSHSLFDNSL
ncbi:SDR family oxidoreductase [Variovorax rhizosphaerae]|uniref:SDR family oxidoreductase n=1 Tax=Variovorax rhizosphaerae TaxID=1836200 RepID=A0ABU8WNZ8_9BURK